MRRIVSVWLPDWPIERLRRQGSMSRSNARPGASPNAALKDTALPAEPLALVASGRHGLTITAVSAAAAAGGARSGMTLADARALLPDLRSRPAEPSADRRALIRLARWCGRYGPGRNIDVAPAAGGEDGDLVLDHGLWIDIAGVAHLFGGETALLDDLARRLSGFGLTARLGLADTLGAAHALARHAAAGSRDGPHGDRSWNRCPEGRCREHLAPLPVEALRLVRPTAMALRRLGLRRIGDLYAVPRSSLERRFREPTAGTGVLARLDQALGQRPEPRRPLRDVPALVLGRGLEAPLVSAAGVEAEARLLIERLCAVLDARGLGARRIRLVLYRADGTMAEASAGTSAPIRSAPRIMALLADKLARLDAGHGIDMLTIEVPVAERLAPAAAPLEARLAGAAAADPAELVDRLSSRLGAGRVAVLASRASHIPERAETRRPALHGHGALHGGGGASLWASEVLGSAPRPMILLERPEPITVTAEVPDGAPAVFSWRRTTRRITRAEGPERIAAEWWRSLSAHRSASSFPESSSPEQDTPLAAGRDGLGVLQPRSDAPRTRDYYRIEDRDGAGYWVFRNGLYGDTDAGGPPAWFLHGLFL